MDAADPPEVPNLLPPLAEEPSDLRGRTWGAENADELVYRLGLLALPVPGLPEQLAVGDVQVAFVRGPVRAQRTVMRQRHGLPVVFDKQMTRVDVGEGELIAVLSLRLAQVPVEFDQVFPGWRARALAAAGVLAAVLDERVVGPELFEDVVLLRKGEFVGAADMHGQVRSFLPFEVNTADRSALEQLARANISEASAAARAARLYRRASLEGPTADAYAMLWVAAECFSSERSPSRRHLESALRDGGLNPDGLPIPVGRLIELRGKIQHQGLEEDDRLKAAFYEMEAVVRCLIRRDAELRGGWWPAPNNPAGFADPFKPAVATFHDRGTTEWHVERLPTVDDPMPLRLPRQVPNARDDPRLDLDAGFGSATEFIASFVVDAIEWQDPEMTLSVVLGPPTDVPDHAKCGANDTRIWLAEEQVDGVEDSSRPEILINLVWTIHSLVAASLAQREGLVSEGDGVAAVEAFGAWSQYRRLVTFGEFDGTSIQVPTGQDPISLGKIAGWAAAGNEAAQAAAAALTGHSKELVEGLIASLRATQPGPPTRLLELAAEYDFSAASAS